MTCFGVTSRYTDPSACFLLFGPPARHVFVGATSAGARPQDDLVEADYEIVDDNK